MHSFRKIFAQPQPVLRYTAAIATTLALAGSIDIVRANAGSTSSQLLESNLSSQLARQDTPVISKVVLADLSGLIILLIIGGTIVAIPLFFGGLVVIGEREVGIVVKKFTTLDGIPITPGEIAGAVIEGHDNFQNVQKFLNAGGSRGLQEQILLSGSWNLNPWFVQVQQIPMTEIPSGYVGVVISYVGKAHVDVSGVSFTHGNLVNPGHKGVWVEPLYPGKHPLNIQIMKVELVPTTNIVLNWSARMERHSYDTKLESLNVRSRDGFSFALEIAQIIHVAANNSRFAHFQGGSLDCGPRRV
jgi:uncharacterized membrane protein YqiK